MGMYSIPSASRSSTSPKNSPGSSPPNWPDPVNEAADALRSSTIELGEASLRTSLLVGHITLPTNSGEPTIIVKWPKDFASLLRSLSQSAPKNPRLVSVVQKRGAQK